jgi:hypothetical protein
VVIAGLMLGRAETLRVCLGDETHAVTSGVVWVMANGWNGFDQARAAVIRDGALHLTGWSGLPADWKNWSEGLRILVGVSTRHVDEPAEARMSTPYQPDNYRSYPFWYTTRVLRADELSADLEEALGEAGEMHARTLVLPRYRRRDLLLGYPYGQPLVGAKVPVYLFGWDRNHCAHHFGLPLGEYVTDAKGRIRFNAPPDHLYLQVRFFNEVHAGPAGLAYELGEGVQVPAYDRVSIGMIWRIPQHHYEVKIPAEAAEAHAVLVGCQRNACGAGCGTMADSVTAL